MEWACFKGALNGIHKQRNLLLKKRNLYLIPRTPSTTTIKEISQNQRRGRGRTSPHKYVVLAEKLDGAVNEEEEEEVVEEERHFVISEQQIGLLIIDDGARGNSPRLRSPPPPPLVSWLLEKQKKILLLQRRTFNQFSIVLAAYVHTHTHTFCTCKYNKHALPRGFVKKKFIYNIFIDNKRVCVCICVRVCARKSLSFSHGFFDLFITPLCFASVPL